MFTTLSEKCQQEPSKDRELFLEKFAGVCEHAGFPKDEAVKIAGNLLPDLLTYDYSSSNGFPNGRNLTDDVINMGIAQLTKGAAPHDGLRPHTDLRAEFPQQYGKANDENGCDETGNTGSSGEICRQRCLPTF